MMNSMNSNQLLEELNKRFSLLGSEHINKNQIAIDVKNDDFHSSLATLKAQGWRQLSILTNVDWLKDNEFQLVAIIFNWDNPIYVQVRTRIDRDNPVFPTITSIYPGAKYYERDVHEFFGVVFEGNPDALKQLFLENWDDIPPLRKDFDSRAYSDQKYRKMDYKVDYTNKEGQEK